jgi:hypothetical protein
MEVTTQMGHNSSRALVRTPNELAPLIKEQVQLGDEAGMEFYREAGMMLIEAKAQLPDGEFTSYAERVTGRSASTCRLWIRAAKELLPPPTTTPGRQNVTTVTPSVTLGEVRGRPTSGYVRRDYVTPIDKTLDRVNVEALRQNQLDERQEYREECVLAKQLIDIGYKALATKLHPDKGGNRAAMSRLNTVKKKLQSVYDV